MKEIDVFKIPTGKWKENCYVVNKTTSKDTLIIDPGGDQETIVKYISANDFDVSAILNTHAHYDHIGAVSCLKQKYRVPFFLHSADEKLLKSANLYVKLFDGSGPMKIPNIDYFFDHCDLRSLIKKFHIDVFPTPGHTQGSVSLLIDDCLFTGDTLFRGKIGRTDLPGGNEKVLKESLKVISKMPSQTSIYPGHGSTSTIGFELKFNDSFKRAIR